MTLSKEAAEARAAGKRFYFNGNPCIHGHVCKRYSSNGRCIKCSQEAHRRKYKPRRASVTETLDLLSSLPEEAQVIAKSIDPVAFKHPGMRGSKGRQQSAIQKTKEILASLKEEGYKISQENDPVDKSQMVDGFGLI